jgi:hypothetical protein
MNLIWTIFLSLILINNAGALSVLQIGDSQSYGIFGERWHKKLQETISPVVHVWSATGSGAEQWASNQLETSKVKIYSPYYTTGPGEFTPQDIPALKVLLARYLPEILIIQLGGNMVNLSDEKIERDVKKLLQQVTEMKINKCIWIAPPNGHARPFPRFNEFYFVLAKAVSRNNCQFIDSRSISLYPYLMGDGIHFDSLGESAEYYVDYWIDHLWRAIRRP